MLNLVGAADGPVPDPEHRSKGGVAWWARPYGEMPPRPTCPFGTDQCFVQTTQVHRVQRRVWTCYTHRYFLGMEMIPGLRPNVACSYPSEKWWGSDAHEEWKRLVSALRVGKD